MVDPAVQARFTALVTGDEEELAAALDEAALLIAAAGQGHDRAWVAGQLARLDLVAEAVPEPRDLGALTAHLFGPAPGLALLGDREGYHLPENSYLDRVLDRRLGIPISLSILAVAVGRRVGVPLCGIGLPGHFLVRHEGLPKVLLDCFDGGRRLTSGDAEALVHGLYGPQAGFDLDWLTPAPARAIVVRVLTNLRGHAGQTADLDLFSWVVRMRCAVPGVPDDDLRLLERLRPDA